MSGFSYCTYVESDGCRIHTTVCLPAADGKFPTMIFRSPYVDAEENLTDEEISSLKEKAFASWLENGYAVVYQHCRGRGRSEGDCIPYIYERQDGLKLHDWIRQQPFYNGELFLFGSSYTSTVHYMTAPWAEDIKGAVLSVQDTEKYNIYYRNGIMKIGLGASWYFRMYKNKTMKKTYADEMFHMLPLTDLPMAVCNEDAEGFQEILMHPRKEDPFWKTRESICEDREVIKNSKIPVLLTTGLYDIYTGGIFDMWNALDPETKSRCALAVQPYDHAGSDQAAPVRFENGTLYEQFGEYPVRWCNFVRGTEEAPVTPGKVTYYQIFGDGWHCDDFDAPQEILSFTLGEGERTYRYLPVAPATFKGGLSTNFGGAAYQDPPNSRYDILSFFTPEFEEDCVVKGKMSAKLRVRSSREDTCFYIRLSLVKPEGDYGLRDDINQISNFDADYIPGSELTMDFSFDEHAFVIRKGEKIRIDVSSSAFPHYVRHTNQKGDFALQTWMKSADNTVICHQSALYVPVQRLQATK